MSTGDQENQEDREPQESLNQGDNGLTEEGVAGEGGAASAEAQFEGEDSNSSPLTEELQQAKDQTLRVQAEMQNLRRRADRDIENAHKYALENFAAELLPVVDNLERAVAAIDVADDAKGSR